MSSPRHILITGASSGIGLALAKAYASDPEVTLHLSGQNQQRIAQADAALAHESATIKFCDIDVTDAEAMRSWIEGIALSAPLDLVIANAGIAGDPKADAINTPHDYETQLRHVMKVNIDGVFNTLLPAIEIMSKQSRQPAGQVAIVSSLAAFRGLDGASAYCASKAAVRSWGEAMRSELKSKGIHLSVICPGFVRSRITDQNKFPMPFFWEADKAAARIKRDLSRNKGRIAFPFPMYLGVLILGALPNRLVEFVTGLSAKRFNKRR